MNGRKANVIGVLCGVLCAACVLLYVNSVHADAEKNRAEVLERYGGEQIEVCVALNDIAPGDVVRASDVGTKLWVSDLLPGGAVKQSSDVVGKTASSSILKGEVVCEQRFQNDSSLLEVPEGFTALSVPAKNVQAVGGALSVGMNVDVYATGATSTTRLLSKVAVLATSMSSKSDGGSSTSSNSASSNSGVQWVTLAVPPQYVEQMVAAAHQSELYFTLPSSQ